MSPEKKNSQKETIVFQSSIFRCKIAVSFREGTSQIYQLYHPFEQFPWSPWRKSDLRVWPFLLGLGFRHIYVVTVISSEASFPKMNDPKNKLHGQVIQSHLFISQLEVTDQQPLKGHVTHHPKKVTSRLARGMVSWQKIPGPLGELIVEKNGRMTSYCWTYESIKQIKQNWEGKFILHPRNLTYIPTIAIFIPGNTFSKAHHF